MQLLPQATKSNDSVQVCALALLDALPPVMRVVRRHMRSHRGKGLSVPQFRVLMTLGAGQGSSLRSVADFLGESAPTTSRIVSGLVSKGLVTRCDCSHDRRRVKLALTARGARLRDTARLATQAQLAEEIAPLSDAQRHAIVIGMRALELLFAPVGRPADNGRPQHMATSTSQDLRPHIARGGHW